MCVYMCIYVFIRGKHKSGTDLQVNHSLFGHTHIYIYGRPPHHYLPWRVCLWTWQDVYSEKTYGRLGANGYRVPKRNKTIFLYSRQPRKQKKTQKPQTQIFWNYGHPIKPKKNRKNKKKIFRNYRHPIKPKKPQKTIYNISMVSI